MIGDLRYALRGLLRAPGFAAAAIVTLALGTGATMAVFAIVNAVLLRPLPYRDPGGVAIVWASSADRTRTWLSLPELEDLSRDVRALSAIAGLTDLRMNLADGGPPEEVQTVAVSASLFPMLGVEIGRASCRERV